MRLLLTIMLLMACVTAQAASHSVQGTAGNDQVVVSGTVPNIEVKNAVLKKLRAIYGADRIVNHLEVGNVTTPAQWGKFVTRMITPDLKQISNGKISVNGNTVEVEGKVRNEVMRQRIIGKLASAFNDNYTVTGSMHVEASKQELLNKTLANRTIKFKTGSATLRDSSKQVLDEMAITIKKLHNPFIQIVGNTDNVGSRDKNILLSLRRAMAVKDYLVKHDVPAGNLSVSGMGPDNPIASNDKAAGRARNRRIDFIVTRQQ